MSGSLSINHATHAMQAATGAPKPPSNFAGANEDELRDAFGSFVGQTLFGQMLKSMRQTVGEPAYFHGGQAEEIFTAQLDQMLAEKISDASHEKFSGPMFELFMMPRR